jgi:hypothetical protein
MQQVQCRVWAGPLFTCMRGTFACRPVCPPDRCFPRNRWTRVSGSVAVVAAGPNAGNQESVAVRPTCDDWLPEPTTDGIEEAVQDAGYTVDKTLGNDGDLVGTQQAVRPMV